MKTLKKTTYERARHPRTKLPDTIKSDKTMNLSSQLGPLSAKFSKSKKILSFIKDQSFGIRNRTLILDSSCFPTSFLKGLLVVAEVLIQGGNILVVDTNPLSSIKDLNLSPQLSVSTKIWISGTITNWQQASYSLKTFSLISQSFGGWLKKHQIILPRYKKSDNWFNGIKQSLIKSHPTLIVVINLDDNLSLIKEAFKLKIPILALVEPNTTSEKIQYPIVINTKCPQTRLLIWWQIWNLVSLLIKQKHKR